MKPFIIFYDDGTEIVACPSSLNTVKPFGIVCIVQERADGRMHILSDKDYYVFVDEHWVVLDSIGLVDYTVHRLSDIRKVLVGRTVDNQSFYDIMAKAKKHV